MGVGGVGYTSIRLHENSLHSQSPSYFFLLFFLALTRTFTILNLTNSTYSFFWLSEEPESLQNPPAFTCLTEKGLIHPEKKAEVCASEPSAQGLDHATCLCIASMSQTASEVRDPTKGWSLSNRPGRSNQQP